jgi:hypothetical protein
MNDGVLGAKGIEATCSLAILVVFLCNFRRGTLQKELWRSTLTSHSTMTVEPPISASLMLDSLRAGLSPPLLKKIETKNWHQKNCHYLSRAGEVERILLWLRDERDEPSPS